MVEGHEHKAFIPYDGVVKAIGPEKLRWVQDRVTRVEKGSVKLAGGEEIDYDFLVVATGSGATSGLPSRVNADEKNEAVEEVREVQRRVKESRRLVVVGGGAAGVELATDARSLYPEKSVTLVHSREAVMHRFGVELQKEALEGLKKLGVEVILGERVVEDLVETEGCVVLRGGRRVECDCLVRFIMATSAYR